MATSSTTSKATRWRAVRGQADITTRTDTRGRKRYRPRPYVNGKVRNLGTFDTLDEAKAARDAALTSARRGGPVVDAKVSRLTVGEVAEAYLAAVAQTSSEGNAAARASQWRCIRDQWAERRVVDLRVTDVEDWLAASTVGRGTTRNRLSCLRGILDRPARDYQVPNVAALARFDWQPVEAPVDDDEVERRHPLTPAQGRALRDGATGRYRVAVVLGLGLGLRSGEARGLTLDRVNFQTGAVRIDRQLKQVQAGQTPSHRLDMLTDKLGFGPLKTRRSYRTVWADRVVLDAIRAHVDEHGTGPRDLILSSPTGAPLHPQLLQAEMRRLRSTVRVDDEPVDLSGFHHLRHTCASWRLDAGATIAEVAEDMGHDVDTAVKYYLHAAKPVDAGRTAGVMAMLDEVDEAATVTPLDGVDLVVVEAEGRRRVQRPAQRAQRTRTAGAGRRRSRR